MYAIIYPICGIILSDFLGFNLMITHIKNINREDDRKLEYNILIFTVLFFSSINWIIYSLWFNNILIFMGSIIVPIGSSLCNIGFYNLLSVEKKQTFTVIYTVFYLFVVVYVAILKFSPISNEIKDMMVNYSLTINVLSCIAPLTPLIDMVKTKSTEKLYLPYTVINMTSSILWLIYGITLNNFFLMAVFAFGIVTSSIEIFVYFLYRRSSPILP
jgi:uncharacterized protein with PQ loop repeat